MELYTLDSRLRRNQVIDKFESLIWTERWHTIGDFELDVMSTLETRSRLMTGTRLAMNNSDRVMIIETVEDKTDDEGREKLLVKGRSLESILENRVAREFMANLTSDPNVWYMTGSPIGVARKMFNDICVGATLDPNDSIPYYQTIAPLPEDPTLPFEEEIIDWVQKVDSLYNAIRDVCVIYDLGFRLYRLGEIEPAIVWEIYAGQDRTTRQTDFPSVVFSTDLDNLKNTTEFASIQEYKNVAYVFSDVGTLKVYAEGVDPTITGFERRIIIVNANVPADHPDIAGELARLGSEELLKHRPLSIFDGEVNQYNEYTYGVDFKLGDLVEVRNKDGVVSYKRVTEQIFVEDANGERSYPTLSVGMFEAPNTWLSYGNSEMAWEDFTTEVWEDM